MTPGTKASGGSGPPLASDVNQSAQVLDGTQDAGALGLAQSVAAPTIAPTTTVVAGTEMGAGTYQYATTFLTGHLRGDGTRVVAGETIAGPTVNVTTTAGNGRVSLTSLPVPSATTIIGKRIYRTLVGGVQRKLVVELANGVTSYTDATPDVNLGANEPTINTTGTSFTIFGKSNFRVKAGDIDDHVYIEFYARSAAQGTRSGYVGYGAAGATTFTVANGLANGNIDFVTTGTGIVTANGQKMLHEANVGSAAPNNAVQLVKALLQPVDTRSTTYTYTSGNITTITTADAGTTVKTITIAYTANGDVNTVTETVGGKTITTTYAYNVDGSVSGETRSVV